MTIEVELVPNQGTFVGVRASRWRSAWPEWQPGLDEDASDCTHTYTEASVGNRPGDVYLITVTIHWNYTWVLNGVDQGPFADPAQPTPTVDDQMGEIQAVGRPRPVVVNR